MYRNLCVRHASFLFFFLLWYFLKQVPIVSRKQALFFRRSFHNCMSSFVKEAPDNGSFRANFFRVIIEQINFTQLSLIIAWFFFCNWTSSFISGCGHTHKQTSFSTERDHCAGSSMDTRTEEFQMEQEQEKEEEDKKCVFQVSSTCARQGQNQMQMHAVCYAWQFYCCCVVCMAIFADPCCALCMAIFAELSQEVGFPYPARLQSRVTSHHFICRCQPWSSPSACDLCCWPVKTKLSLWLENIAAAAGACASCPEMG